MWQLDNKSLDAPLFQNTAIFDVDSVAICNKGHLRTTLRTSPVIVSLAVWWALVRMYGCRKQQYVETAAGLLECAVCQRPSKSGGQERLRRMS